MKNILFAVLFSGCVSSPSVQTAAQTVVADSSAVDSVIVVADTLKMLFAGDVMGHGMQITGAWRDGGDSCYNYHPSFQWVKDYVSAADLAIANLEVTFGGAPYTGYPQFSTHESLADALRDAGFDVLLTANNHALDRGKKGMERTIDILDGINMPHTGTFKDSADRRRNHPLIVEKNNFRLAMLNYTYGTNGIPVEKPNIVNFIDTVRMAADLIAAQNMEPDFIITCIHWGDEYKTTENAYQRKIASFLARHGCDLIVGSHPHVVQPLSKIPSCKGDSIYVIYSLGNFISNMRDRYRNGGITLEITLTKNDGKVSVESAGYEPFFVYRYPLKGVSVFRLLGINHYLQNTELYPAFNQTDKNLIMQFYNDTKKIMSF